MYCEVFTVSYIMYFSKIAFYANSCFYFRECSKLGGVLLNIKKKLVGRKYISLC